MSPLLRFEPAPITINETIDFLYAPPKTLMMALSQRTGTLNPRVFDNFSRFHVMTRFHGADRFRRRLQWTFRATRVAQTLKTGHQKRRHYGRSRSRRL